VTQITEVFFTKAHTSFRHSHNRSILMTQTFSSRCATRAKAAASAVLLGLLAACSGGDGLVSTSPSTVFVPTPSVAGPSGATPTVADIAISGTAAVGAPLANAKVSILCNSGAVGKETQADSTGKYSTTVTSACIAPYMLKVTGVDTSTTPTATITLYAFADKAGNINITPLTDIAAKFATNNDPDGEYEAVLKQIKTTDSLWGTSTKAAAQANLQKVLDKLGVTSSIALDDLLHGKFDAKLGDKTDDLLEKLKTQRGGVPLKDLVEQIANRGGNTLTATERKPWLAFFPQQKSFTLTASGCSGEYRNSLDGPGFIQTNLSNASVTATFSLTTTGFKVSAVISQAVSVLENIAQATAVEESTPAKTTYTTKALNNIAAPDFVFATGRFDVKAFNNLLGFNAESSVKPDALRVGFDLTGVLNAAAPAVTQANTSPSAVTSQIFSLLAESKDGSRAYLKCASALPAITAASRPDFSIPARIASLAGTATSITSPVSGDNMCIGDFATTPQSGTFTYAVSPSTGDVKFNSKSLASNWFFGAYADYSENHVWSPTSQSSISINAGPLGGTASSPKGFLYMQRSFNESGAFVRTCNSPFKSKE
jgi:hypothetical protein